MGLLHSRLEGCLVDAVQKIPFPHPFALLEQHGIEVAGNAGAYLDCFEKEPYQGPLAKLPNVVLTAHIGSYAREARVRMETEAVENLLEALGK